MSGLKTVFNVSIQDIGKSNNIKAYTLSVFLGDNNWKDHLRSMLDEIYEKVVKAEKEINGD